MQFDDTGFDNSAVIALAAYQQYHALLAAVTAGYFVMQAEAHPVQARRGNAGGTAFPVPFNSTFAGQAIYREASLIIRRVGATIPPHPTSRCLVGALRPDLIADYPRGRRVNTADPQLVLHLAAMNATNQFNLLIAHEVQFDRNTGDAWTIEHYSVPTRTARVWQRAGYPHR